MSVRQAAMGGARPHVHENCMGELRTHDERLARPKRRHHAPKFLQNITAGPLERVEIVFTLYRMDYPRVTQLKNLVRARIRANPRRRPRAHWIEHRRVLPRGHPQPRPGGGLVFEKIDAPRHRSTRDILGSAAFQVTPGTT